MFIGAQETRDGESGSPLESRTRSRVLRMVSADGPITAAELGRLLDLTPAAVRRHLDVLVEQGAIVEHEPPATRRGRGRPARAYVVGEAGHEVLGADYEGLAVEVLRFVEEQQGPEGVAEFARRRMAEMEERYATELAHAGDDPAARVEALVETLSDDGFAASARPVGGVGTSGSAAGSAGTVAMEPLSGIQLCQGHCPVQRAASAFPAFCEAETDAFSRLLGVHVQRLATLAGGDHVCTTFVPTAAVRKTTDAAGVGLSEVAAQTMPAARTGASEPSIPTTTAAGTSHVIVNPAQRHTTTTNDTTNERSRS